MILSASRRTDIPAFYSDWFFKRIKEGFVYVRNPMNPHAISRIELNPEVIDCIIFWTKDPTPMIERLNELNDFMFYYHITINPYDTRIEENVSKKSNIIDTFKKISEKIGKRRTIWRYSPLILSEEMDINYHIQYFEELAKRLSGSTERCYVSFIDIYKKIKSKMEPFNLKNFSENNLEYLVQTINEIAKSYNITLYSCGEKVSLSRFGIPDGKCVDDELIESLIGQRIKTKKDKNQRPTCKCVESIDVGEYNSCTHDCIYCYANLWKTKVYANKAKHDPDSPLLIGHVNPDDIIKVRPIKSFKVKGLFD